MFNALICPVVDFSLAEMSRKAQALTDKLSISGVQPKLSVKFDKKQNELIPAAVGGEYILKPQVAAFANVPENEQCCMDIAGALNIDIPLHCLIELKDKTLAYVVKRFDRVKGKKIHQEDFSQLLEQPFKYNGSVEQIGKKLKEISSAPGYDVQLFFERVVFNFIIGNGDAHLKNYSIFYKDDSTVRLTPAYDIVCSKLVISDEADSALTINGKKNKLDREDFDALAEYFNIPLKVRYEGFADKSDLIKSIIESSFLSKEKQQQFIDLTQERMKRLRLV